MGKIILVTGGCGYIGSHVVYELLDHGYQPVVIDRLSNSQRDALPADIVFYEEDVCDAAAMEKIFSTYKPDAVLHFAALISVDESVREPLTYYHNNVTGTRTIIDMAVKHGVKKMIFSSTAAVYGTQEKPVGENSNFGPTSPYGRSKLMSEQILHDTVAATDLKAVVLRYFNVAGADPNMRTGQRGKNVTHLIARAIQAAQKTIPHFSLFGNDYTTKDGTCVRDFIHVSDLAAAHRIVLETEFTDKIVTFNCGYGAGYSVRQIIDSFKAVTQTDFTVIEQPRRPGDSAQIVADSSALQKATVWRPQYNDIKVIIDTAWRWAQRLG